MTTPIDLYYWPTPNGWKISIMLEECGLAYNVRYVDIARGEQFEPDFLAIAPNGRMPAIVDPEGPGGEPIALFESGAILQYLGDKTGRFFPADPRARAKVNEWLFWQVGGVGPMAGQAHHFLNYARTDVPYAKERYANECNRLYGVLDSRLEGRDYVAGDYSIADMAIWPWAILASRQGQSRDDFPHMSAWIDRVGARPAVAKGKALGEEKRKSLKSLRDDDQAHATLFGQRRRG